MLKKIFVIGGALLVIFSLAGLLGGYLYLRGHLKEIPAMLKTQLQKSQINLDFQKVESPPIGLSLILRGVSVGGPTLPVSLKADSVMAGISFTSWPPIAINLEMKGSVIQKNPEAPPVEEKKSIKEQGSGTAFKYAGLFASLVQVRVHLENISAPAFGFEKLSVSAQAKGFRLSRVGLDHAELNHELSVDHLVEAPWLLGVHTKGTAIYDINRISTRDFQVGLGPFLVNLEGNVDIPSQGWSAKLQIPKAPLSKTSTAINAKALNWIRPESGEVQLNIEAQGVGGDPKSLKAKGALNLSQAAMEITHPEAKGKVVANVYSTFTKDAATILDLKGDVDLSELGISHEDLFAKERGIPLKIVANLKGNEELLSFPAIEVTFNNLHAALEGTYASKAKAIQLGFRVPATSLVGWERFFPKYSSIQTKGSLEATGSYKGPTEDWKAGDLKLDLKANNIKVPVIKGWIPNKNLALEGIIDINSITNIEMSQASLRNLSSQTEIDLKDNLISYGELFAKKRGTPFFTQLLIQSTNNKADIKKASIQLGNLSAVAKGTINNFTNPIANLKVEAAPFNLTELLSFLPTAKAKAVTQIQGNMALRSSITGPLLSKEGPAITGAADLKRLSLIYELENKKKIRLNDLTGTVNFTKDSVSSTRFKMSFPQTDLTGSFAIRGFEKPDISFNLDGSRFALADFYDAPKGQSLPPGAVPVPVSSKGAKPENDFRSNPMVKNLKLKGSATLRKVDLGYAQSDLMSANISMDNLLLEVKPFVMQIYQGKITSTTEWNGRSKIPTTKQDLRVEGVNANQFLSSYSDKAKDLLEGSFFTNMTAEFSGLDADEIKKSLAGKGDFSLKNGKVRTVRFTKGPLESLKKTPLIGKGINKTDWDETIKDASGGFEFKEGKLLLSNLVLHAPYFDATATNASIDTNQNIQANMIWTPKENIVSGESLEALKDGEGKTSLPLILSGPLTSPNVSIDQGVIEGRIKGYATRKLEAEKNKAVNDVKKKAEDEVKKRLNQGLGNIFK